MAKLIVVTVKKSTAQLALEDQHLLSESKDLEHEVSFVPTAEGDQR